MSPGRAVARDVQGQDGKCSALGLVGRRRASGPEAHPERQPSWGVGWSLVPTPLCFELLKAD